MPQLKTGRIGWDFWFLIQAHIASLRSHDTRTKHGSLLVRDKQIIATGYNGFISEIDDSTLPNHANPLKYNYFIHSELNAILNCAKQGKSTLGCVAYITGPPCTSCLQYLWQAGIRKIYHGKKKSHMMIDEQAIINWRRIRYLMGDDILIQELDYTPEDILDHLKENLK
jgi:dCMP deaminase